MKRTFIAIMAGVVISLISIINIHSQNLYFKHLGIKDGLSQVCIPSIYQDEYGAMWIGTSEGVNRYNGVSMTKLQGTGKNAAWLRVEVTKITGNKNGFVYVVSGSSLVSVCLKTGEIACLKEDGVDDIFSERDTLWCICRGGIYYHTGKDRELKFFTKRLPSLYPFSKILVKGSKIYSATAASVFVIDKKNPQKHDKITDIDSNIICICVDKFDNLWVGTWNGVYKITKDNSITNFNSASEKGGISHNQIRCMTEDGYGNIWCGTFLGLDCYNQSVGRWQSYTRFGDSPNTLSHISILSLFTDNKGNIWTGTYFGGVNVFNPDPEASYFYHAAPLRNDWLNFSVVGKMAKDNDGNMWICTEGGGMDILNPKTGHFSYLTHDPGNPSTIGSNNLKSIYFNPGNGRMYIGTHWGGLYVYDTKFGRGHCVRNGTSGKSLPNDIVNDIIPYKDGLILLTQGGIVCMDTETEEISKLHVNEYAEKILGKKFCYETLMLDSRNRLWLGHIYGGVTCVNLHTSEVEYFRLDSMKNSKVSHIYEDPRGEIYVCTLGSGLFHYVNHKNLFTPHTCGNLCMPNDYCYFVCSTKKTGFLYVLNGSGISLFDASEGKAVITNRVFDQSYSLGSAIFRDGSGKLYIGGTNGLAVINEDLFANHDHKASILPDRLFVCNTEILPGDSTGILKDALQCTKKIRLSYKMNNVTFEFTSFDYIENIHHPYEYKLEGFDHSWNIANGKRVTYTNLPPGKYTLKARNILPHGKGKMPCSSIDITISPPFYASTVAYVLYTAMILVMIVLVVKTIVRQATLRTSLVYERNEKNRIEELNKIKIDFFTNISHELRTPLTLILVQLEGLIHYENINHSIASKLQKIYKNTQNLLNLSSELIDFEKQSEGKIEVEELDLVGYAKQIFSSFSELAKRRKINCHFSSSSEQINVWFDSKQMYKALSILIDNVLKFSMPEENSEVYMNIYRSQSEILISITDAGTVVPSDELGGIFLPAENVSQGKASTGYNHIGLSIVKKIVEMHHGSVSVESVPGKGTTITISLLAGSHHFSPEEFKQNGDDCVIMETGGKTEVDVMPDKAEEETEGMEYDENNEIGKPNILLVEDNEELCQVLKNVFQPAYTLYISHNGTEGFEMASSIHPDMVICNLYLPGMSGKDLCYKIKNNVELSDISVVILASVGTTESMVKTLIMGADDYIVKPFDVRLLYARVRGILKNKKRLVAWHEQNVGAQTTEADAISESDRKLLKKCIEIIRNNFENTSFDVSAISNELCMSRSTFYAKFKQIAGVPPNEFITKIKLEEAMKILKTNPELNISEISVRLGFSSPRYFSRMFKSFFGVTPQSIRK